MLWDGQRHKSLRHLPGGMTGQVGSARSAEARRGSPTRTPIPSSRSGCDLEGGYHGEVTILQGWGRRAQVARSVKCGYDRAHSRASRRRGPAHCRVASAGHPGMQHRRCADGASSHPQGVAPAVGCPDLAPRGALESHPEALDSSDGALLRERRCARCESGQYCSMWRDYGRDR